MTISEASQLIMQAAVFGSGGEIYVLDMGAPVKAASLPCRTAHPFVRENSRTGYPDRVHRLEAWRKIV
jgi:FlaA1/EpsC-like NDP-sugar epimerase